MPTQESRETKAVLQETWKWGGRETERERLVIKDLLSEAFRRDGQCPLEDYLQHWAASPKHHEH